jgi:signal transduction histidine kinase
LCGFKRKIEMDKNLLTVLEFIQQYQNMPAEQKEAVLMALKAVDKELQILSFKLDRTEKVKRTTAILLEETIEELEHKRIAVEESNQALQKTLEDLKAAQDQLVQQEKLASLGQLTAGIAHEIKNPLNFVNNFSEVSMEMIEEVLDSRLKTQDSRHKTEADEIEEEILEDIKANLKKIHEHGTRANGIVTSMLQHSRGGSGKMEPTDLNALIKEYVNLSFHGMRAGKNPINVDLVFDLDPKLGEVSLIKEDFTRVVINLCNNAFDACAERSRSTMKEKVLKTEERRRKTEDGNSENIKYDPKLKVITSLKNGQVRITFEDNGPGIPEEIRDKILQPFFTTKKGTEGTGLGLSITNDIIKAHGGELSVLSKAETGTKFIIQLPIQPK